jgi:uncharacterized protein (DUF983 family)
MAQPASIALPESPRIVVAMARGFRGRCPACGRGRLFRKFLKVADACGCCGTAFHHHRADDLPPYLVILVVGHVVGYGIFQSETRFAVPLWFHLALWPALTLVLCMALLQPMKGAVVGLQFALGMHGFGEARSASRARNPEGEGGGHDAPGDRGTAGSG